ncbi:hypothetical protein [Streptomyces sp. NPDC047000]|uniref:hypothetical protein n=1 Tax=Streptomyces sp. NPDC047000 TaxID=3155474 RepID=UPI0033FC6FA0
MPTWFWLLAFGLLALAFFISLSISLMAFINTNADSSKSVHDAIAAAGSAFVKMFTLTLITFGFVLTLIGVPLKVFADDAAASPPPRNSSPPPQRL